MMVVIGFYVEDLDMLDIINSIYLILFRHLNENHGTECIWQIV